MLFDLFGGLLPGGDAWLHEEYHRAVMGNRGIDSFNDVYRFNLAASTIAVSHVSDSALVRLKATHPAEQVRLGEAGIEGEHLMIRRLEENRFFRDSHGNHIPLYWLTKINSIYYVMSGATPGADTLTDEMNAQDGANVSVRDFTGHDFTAWVYDLHRSAEPYAARGVHPSGVGIDRYIRFSDLTDEERTFLRHDGQLQLLNLLDPFLFGFEGIVVHEEAAGRSMLTANVAHYLTSFGHSIDVNVLYRGNTRAMVTVRRYTNGARSFPGVEGTLVDFPVDVAGREMEVSPRVALWLQPEDQAFRTTRSARGALASVRVRPMASAAFGPYVEVEAKTAGWVAGSVTLDAGVSFRFGGSLLLPQ